MSPLTQGLNYRSACDSALFFTFTYFVTIEGNVCVLVIGGWRPCCVLLKFFSGYRYTAYASVDMDISMDIHVKICGYGFNGYRYG